MANSINCISPIDGRYNRYTDSLRKYFSEYALFKYRVQFEIEYFISLCKIPLPQLENAFYWYSDNKLFDNNKDKSEMKDALSNLSDKEKEQLLTSID